MAAGCEKPKGGKFAMIWAILIGLFGIWGLLKTAEAAGQRAGNGEYGRLAIAVVALAVPVLFALVWGVN